MGNWFSALPGGPLREGEGGQEPALFAACPWALVSLAKTAGKQPREQFIRAHAKSSLALAPPSFQRLTCPSSSPLEE